MDPNMKGYDMWSLWKNKEEETFRLWLNTSPVYLMHRVTRRILRCFLLLLCLYLWLMSDPITCHRFGNCKCEDKTLTSYCWVHGTHTVKRLLPHSVHKYVPYPGVGQIQPGDELIHHWGYIFIGPLLAVSALLSSLVYMMWAQVWTSYQMDQVLEVAHVLVVKKVGEVAEKKEKLLCFFRSHRERLTHSWMVGRVIVCELLDMLLIFMQISLWNYLFNGQFTNFGPEVLAYRNDNDPDRIDPLDSVFPKVTTCHLTLIGPSGEEQLKEALCVLPMNAIFGHFFTFLWFWYVMMATFSVLAVVYRVLTVFSRSFRVIILKNTCSSVSREAIQSFCANYTFGGWFVMLSLKNCVNSIITEDILELLGQEIIDEKKEKDYEKEKGYEKKKKDNEKEKKDCAHKSTYLKH